MLVVLGGLPGTGKTTIGTAIAARLAATYIRVDVIEHALASRLGPDVGPAGYVVAHALAVSNLRLGNLVVADSVNPVPDSREGWRGVADEAGAPIVEIEVTCGDASERRRRVETREADIPGFVPPTWAAVAARAYAPWDRDRIVIDTAGRDPAESIAEAEAAIHRILGAAPRPA